MDLPGLGKGLEAAGAEVCGRQGPQSQSSTEKRGPPRCQEGQKGIADCGGIPRYAYQASRIVRIGCRATIYAAARSAAALRWRLDWRSRQASPLSCTPPVVMQKASQGANWTENADNADATEIAQAAYFLLFTSEMRKMQKGLAERGGFEPPIELLTL